MIPAPHHQTALLLPGGGARAAYQVGVLKGLAELLREAVANPFPIVCGTSAGALNAVALATRAEHFSAAAQWLEELWLRLHVDHVYQTGWLQIAGNALRLGLSLFNTGVAVGAPVGLLNNGPLRALLHRELDFDRIGANIKAGHLRAVCVTAMNYSLGVSMSFFQGGPEHAGWQRVDSLLACPALGCSRALEQIRVERFQRRVRNQGKLFFLFRLLLWRGLLAASRLLARHE